MLRYLKANPATRMRGSFLACALAPGIRVVSVSPGLVETEFLKTMDAGWRDDQVVRAGSVLAIDGARPLA